MSQFQAAAKLQPSDTLSAQLVAEYRPAGAPQPAPAPAAVAAAPGIQGTLAGQWTARPAEGVKVVLAIQNDGSFTWAASAPGEARDDDRAEPRPWPTAC